MEVIIETVREITSQRKNFCENEGNSFAYTHEFHCIPFTCYIEVNETLGLIQYRAYATFTLRGDDVAPFKEYVRIINYRCPVGSIAYSEEIDELRYKNALAFSTERPTKNAIETMISISEQAFEAEMLGLIKAHNGEPIHELLSM